VLDFKSKYDSLFERQKALLDEMALARNHIGSIHQKTSAILQKKKNKYPDTLARLIRQQSESDRKSFKPQEASSLGSKSPVESLEKEIMANKPSKLQKMEKSSAVVNVIANKRKDTRPRKGDLLNNKILALEQEVETLRSQNEAKDKLMAAMNLFHSEFAAYLLAQPEINLRTRQSATDLKQRPPLSMIDKSLTFFEDQSEMYADFLKSQNDDDDSHAESSIISKSFKNHKSEDIRKVTIRGGRSTKKAQSTTIESPPSFDS